MLYYNTKVNGEHIDCESVDMSIDWDSYCWTIDIVLNDLASWVKCIPGSTLVIMIDYVYYTFIIDSRDRDTVFNNWTLSAFGRSSTSVLGEGSTPIHKTWGQIMSKSVVLELADTISVDYNILNWTIPKGKLESDGELPIEIIKNIAEASGGSIYTSADGTLVISPKYDTSPAEFDLGNTDMDISSYDDILSLNETRITGPGYNRVEVSSDPISDSVSLNLTVLSITGFEAIIRADVYPFLESLELYHASDDSVVFDSDGENPKTEVLEEQVAFIDGSASVEHLVKSIDSVVYDNTDLGNVSSDGTNLTSDVVDNGLAAVTYTTEYHTYKIITQDDRNVLVYTR